MEAAIPKPTKRHDCPDCGEATSSYVGQPCPDCHDRRKAASEHDARIAAFLSLPGAEENRTAGLEAFRDNPGALAAAREFVGAVNRGERPDLYFFGGVGRGKTYLAVATCRTLLADSAFEGRCSIVRATRLMLEIFRTFKDDRSDALDVIERYAKPDVLVLDDLGAEKHSEYSMGVLYELVCSRAHRSTIYTSNLSLDEVVTRDATGYMERITSRINGKARLIKFTGPEHRAAA